MLAVASLGMVIAFIDATIVNIAFPDIERSFPGTSISTLSWVLNAYNIVFAAFLVAAGRIADLLGRRRIFIIGVELFSVASLLCALAPSPGALIAFRVVQALGAALLVPASLALVLNAFPRGPPRARRRAVVGGRCRRRRARSFARWHPGLDRRLAAGVPGQHPDRHRGGGALAPARLIESRTPGRRRMPDLPGAASVRDRDRGARAGCGRRPGLGVVERSDDHAHSSLAGAFGAVFIWRCTWHRSPIFDLSLFRVRTFSVANSLTVIGAAGFYGYTLTNVLFLTGVWRYSVLQAGFAMTIGPVVAVDRGRAVQPDRAEVGHRPVLVAGGLLWGAAVMWFVERTTVTPDFLGVWLPGMILLGIGAGRELPEPERCRRRVRAGEQLRDGDRDELGCPAGRAALGVALVVAILGVPSPADVARRVPPRLDVRRDLHVHGWLGCLLIGRVNVGVAPSLGSAARVVLVGRASDRLSRGCTAARSARDHARRRGAGGSGPVGGRLPRCGAAVRGPRTRPA